MIAEEERKQVLTAIEQLEDEAAFAKIAATVAEVLAVATPIIAKPEPGFMRGSVTYLTDDWDAPLPDSEWKHNDAE